MEEEKLLISSLEKLNIEVNDEQIRNYFQFMDYLLEVNKHINLTSITDRSEFITKHIVDSLIMLDKKFINKNTKVLDLGTGGGFPGIPLKILYPEINLTLVDSVKKKLNFINDAAKLLNLDVELVHERAEILGKNLNFREKYDIVISRAVANMQILSELCLPLVKVGGYMITSKGPKYLEELENSQKALNILGGRLKEIQEIDIPYSEFKRYILYIEKHKQTPKNYPRKPGTPNKNPL